MSTVNRENIQAWVDALRSGKYNQTKEVLHARDDQSYREDQFCCLGVACDISGIGDWEGEYYVEGKERWSGTLPPPVRRWLGLRSSDPTLRGNKHAVALNDVVGLSFAEIADLVEAKYLGVTNA